MSSVDAFYSDDQGSKFRGMQGQDRLALEAVLTSVLADPIHQQRMEDAERVHGRPALAGVVGAVEALGAVRTLRSTKPDQETRWVRQAIGVAVKVTMLRLGWRTTGRKGSLTGLSDWFTRAERYAPPEPDEREDPSPVEGTRRYASWEETFAAMDTFGTAEEQQADYEYLMAALAKTRAEEGRPF